MKSSWNMIQLLRPKNCSKAGSEFRNKSSFTKKSEHNKESSLPQAKIFWGFVKCFSQFAKGVYEKCDHNFFNLATIIAVVFQ